MERTRVIPPSSATESSFRSTSESGAQRLARRALFASCVVALLFSPVVVAVDGGEDAAALLAYIVILAVLVPATLWL